MTSELAGLLSNSYTNEQKSLINHKDSIPHDIWLRVASVLGLTCMLG